MQRFFFKLQYHGPSFNGWQKQPVGLSVQQCLQDVVKKEFDLPSNFFAAGRTDAGVHALGQVAHVDLETKLPGKALLERLNKRLPRGVFIRDVKPVDGKLHACRSALEKHYRYLIYTQGRRSPLYDELAWVNDRPMNTEAIKKAMQYLIGQHDFRSFMATDGASKTTVRTLHRCELSVRQHWVRFDFVGNGFLKHMVRNLVGTLVDVGHGRLKPSQIPEILESRRRNDAGRNAPPQGLYLMSVRYPQEVF